MRKINPDTVVDVTLFGERFTGTAVEVVTTLRKTARLVVFSNNEEFMREWAYRSELFTKIPIIWADEGLFIQTNILAGLMQTAQIQ